MDSLGKLQAKRQRHFWVEGRGKQKYSMFPSPKLAAAPVVVLPHQLCWWGQHHWCFGQVTALCGGTLLEPCG